MGSPVHLWDSGGGPTTNSPCFVITYSGFIYYTYLGILDLVYIQTKIDCANAHFGPADTMRSPLGGGGRCGLVQGLIFISSFQSYIEDLRWL